jgi:hypothetical protein
LTGVTAAGYRRQFARGGQRVGRRLGALLPQEQANADSDDRQNEQSRRAFAAPA